MPDYLSVIAAEPEVVSGDDHTFDSLQRHLEERARSFKGTVRVLFSSPWEDASLGVFTVTRGEVESEFSTLSQRGDVLAVPACATVSPRLTLAGDADRFADALVEAAGEGAPDEAVPYSWESLEKMLAVAQLLAGALEGPPVNAVVMVEGQLGLLTLDRVAGVRLEPLYFWFDDPAARELASRHVAAVEPASRPALAGDSVAVMADALQQRSDPLGVLLVPHRPGSTALTQGSAKKRIERTWEASAEELVAALDDPANQGERFDQVRVACYQRLPAGASTLGLMVRRLPVETEEGRCAIYTALSMLADGAAHQALAEAFEHDAANEGFLATLVWRQRGVVDRLIARLVQSWASDRALADRIVRTLKDEYISVPAGLLKGAPAELVRALGTLVEASG